MPDPAASLPLAERCNCATWGSATHCSIHTQADFDAQNRAVEPSDSDVVFDMVARLVARGYRVSVSIELPGGGGMTLQGEPDGRPF